MSQPNEVTLSGPWAEAMARWRERPALVEADGRVTTYAELEARARAFLAELRPGRQLVFLETKNSVESIAAYVACLMAGHAVHLFDGQGNAEAFARLVDHYRPNAIVRYPDGSARIERGDPTPVALHPDLRVLLSTSGSTGSAKLVKLSERNVASNALSIVEYLQIDETERAITSLKFNYSFGMSVVNSHLIAGASLLLTDASVTDSEFWELFNAQEATSFAGVPFSYESLARMDGVLAQAKTLRYATQAGGRLSPELVQHFARLSREQGWRFYVMYGQTEAAPRIAYLPPDLAEERPDAIGRPIPGGEIRILDEEGGPITEPGQQGELCYRGPNVMMGYAEDREAMAGDETPDHLLTGDIAEWTREGLARIVGRTARFVKPFGLRVNLDEMEGQLRAHAPNAACGGTDDMVVLALRRDDGLDRGAALAEMTSRYGLPSFVFRAVEYDELPRLANGKVDYRSIVADAQKQTASARPKGKKLGVEWVLARNQMATLLLSGLWHGAAWTFVTWGLFHGVMLVCQRQSTRALKGFYERSRALRKISLPIQIALVFALVGVSRVFFRSDSLAEAWTIFGNLLTKPYDWAGLGGKGTLLICGCIILLVFSAEALVETGVWRRVIARRRLLRTAVAIGALLLVLVLGEFSGGRFIYVQF